MAAAENRRDGRKRKRCENSLGLWSNPRDPPSRHLRISLVQPMPTMFSCFLPEPCPSLTSRGMPMVRICLLVLSRDCRDEPRDFLKGSHQIMVYLGTHSLPIALIASLLRSAGNRSPPSWGRWRSAAAGLPTVQMTHVVPPSLSG